VKRIFVALDGSPRAPQVLAAAVRLGELTGAQLVLYRAISVTPDLPREAFAPFIGADTRLEDFLIHSARHELSRLAETVAPGRIEQLVVGFAIPWDGICREARERDADLIMIGSHGYGGIDRLLGTVAAKVVNHADRNVLVVRTAL